MFFALIFACADETAPVELEAMPDAADWSMSGPGGPAVSFDETELLQPCAWLNGNADSAEHHNLVQMHDGYLLFPWAPEDAGGGITFFDFSDPCDPQKVGEVWADHMRETHTLATGWVDGREYLAVDYQAADEVGGIGFFDITDRENPEWVSQLAFDSYYYEDAYLRVALSSTWVGDRLFVPSGLLGVIEVDVSDPLNPEFVHQEAVIAHLAGTFHVIGDIGISSSAGLARFLVYDISDPDDWEVLADVDVAAPEMTLTNFYFANMGGEYALFARKDEGGGPIVYDLRDPTDPQFVSHTFSEEGDGGYIFRHGELLFQGESNFGAIYSFDDPTDPVELDRIELSGDFDTLTPIGNIAVASVDEKGDEGQATGIFPWDTEPDADPPGVAWHRPTDGGTWFEPTTAIGLSFDEMIEPASVHAGSFRVWDQDGAAIPGRFYTMEAITNFVPDTPFDGTVYVEVPAGGIVDGSGNALQDTLRFSFSTTEQVLPWPE